MKEKKQIVFTVILTITLLLAIKNTSTLGTVSETMDKRIDNLNGQLHFMKDRYGKNYHVHKKEDTFNSVFRDMYNKYGEGHLFEWNGKIYTTDKEKEVTITKIQ